MDKTRIINLVAALPLLLALGGCKYYGSALPPEYPLGMDDAMAVANDNTSAGGGSQRPVIKKVTRPRVERPSYLPEKELAIVSPPKTLLVWTFPHVTDDNTRVFGNWSTIFLTDRYEWVRPANELGENEDDAGVPAGRPNIDAPGRAAAPVTGNLDGAP